MTKGFVYILRNDAMPGLLKIGYSVKVPTERVEELFTTGVPEPFKLAYYCLVENADKVESAIHRNLAISRHKSNREFFRVELEAVVRCIATLCNPEHEWVERGLQPFVQSVASGDQLPASGINIDSRHDDEEEIKEMGDFVEAARLRSLTPYVRSLFYDSNSCCCYFELADEVEQSGHIANELLQTARETIRQFDWFGQIQHGVGHQPEEF